MCACGWTWDWELKRPNDPSDIYVFYYGEGGGVKSPDLSVVFVTVGYPLTSMLMYSVFLGTDFLKNISQLFFLLLRNGNIGRSTALVQTEIPQPLVDGLP